MVQDSWSLSFYLSSYISLIQHVLCASFNIYICLCRLGTFLFPAEPAIPYAPSQHFFVSGILYSLIQD